MQVQRLRIKIDAPGSRLDQAALIPIFHEWIRARRLGDVLLIDVADYRHVHHGPGVMLIGHAARYSMDEAGGELGLCYMSRRDEPGDASVRLRGALHAALQACVALEQEPALGGLRFDGGRLRVQVSSRLLAPNTPNVFDALEPPLRVLLEALCPDTSLAIERLDDARLPLTVEVRASAPVRVAAMLARSARGMRAG